MNGKQEWWIDFFKGGYSDVVLTTQPDSTYAFIKKLCNIETSLKIYDQCCGKGYLSAKFAEEGHCVTGLDTSSEYIQFARENFTSSRLEFLLEDARFFVRADNYDVVINWNTSCAYSEDDDENKIMFEAAAKNLKSGGKFVMSTMCEPYIKKHFQKYIVKQVPCGQSSIITIRESYIDNSMMKSNWLIIYPDGRRETAYGQTKMYSPSQLKNMLRECGVKPLKIYGGPNFEPFNSDNPSLIVYGIKM
ncbi:MAG: class I SAM-dependent methyltransferase [Bacteroidales bacterium]|nr:class I SAM-dependent methyltransferase [Bacteroidales bacterium]